MTPKEKLNLIKKNTQEIVTEEDLISLLKTKRCPTVYLGYAPTGLLHLGHLVPLIKLSDFLKAGFKVVFLSADLHAYLDDQKTLWELLYLRSRVYTLLVKTALKVIKTPSKKITFVRGSDFQLKKEYFLKVLRLLGLVTFDRARRAASEVVRFGKHPKVGGFVYPLMQIIDILSLKADVSLGGIDQRGIYMLAREIFPEINQEKPICVFTPLISNLAGSKMKGKMSASEEKSKISLLDSPEQVSLKIKEAFCPAKEKKDNPLLELLQYVIFPILENQRKDFLIERPLKYGGNKKYSTYSFLEKDFLEGLLHPFDLKHSLIQSLNQLLDPFRKEFAKEKNKKLLKKAYS